MPQSAARAPEPFTVAFPEPLPAEKQGEHWWFTAAGRRVRLSNLDKVFWPTEGYTKGDLVAYYANVAEVMLPHLQGRPLTMKRMPDGADGPHFYEKNAPQHTPDWVPRCRVHSDDATGGEIDFLMAADVASLLFVANLGCIEFHPLHSRCPTIEQPDYLFFDLDPFEPATFSDVLAVASHVRSALDALGLPSYPKTSGATGMQIYVPIVAGPSYEQVREFVGTVGRAIRRVDPERVTMEWDIGKRAGKVFIDHNMNRRGANIAAVYSVRPEPGAQVSTPLTWDEVTEGDVRPSDFTIANVHERLARTGNLFAPMLTDPVDVRNALEAVGVAADAEADEAATRSGGDLTTYEGKRDFGATPEPGPGEGSGAGDVFVIQKHNATRLHYDLRLERDGVLRSWAVPKGLPSRTGVRHLAVQTEDHPMSYADFSGEIPAGQYGAGEVLIFDRGTYRALEWTDDKVTFRLDGSRHAGEYHLVKTSEGWLVFLSSRSQAEQLPDPPVLEPMLAEGGHQPFDDPAWRFEPKLDGVRTLCTVTPAGTTLRSRSGRDHTSTYPELANLATHVNALQAIVDGEIVAHDDGGRPSFERLQQRMNLTSAADVEKARRTTPVVLYAFDLLWYDGEDLTGRPLTERRERLEEVTTEGGPIRLTLYRDGDGRAFFEAAKKLGLEGVVAKRLGSVYKPGQRSKDWRKVKAMKRQDCVVIGWTPGKRSRSRTLGALLVAAHRDGELVWIGQVGSGFTGTVLEDLLRRLESLEVSEPPIDDPALRDLDGARWVRPELVCEVEYLERTTAGKLRAPSFKGLREDKAPAEAELEEAVS